MKKGWKILIVGLVLGGAELGAAAILSGVAKVASFEDASFLLGLVTFVVGLLSMFGVSRVRTGASAWGPNANAQGAFMANAAFEEQRMLNKMSSGARRQLSRFSVGSMALLLAAVIAWSGFGISLLF